MNLDLVKAEFTVGRLQTQMQNAESHLNLKPSIHL
jgi:hypothetical protein